MEQLRLFIDQLIALGAQEDLISIGREINDLKIAFDDHLLESERLEQIASLEANERGEQREPVDFKEIRLEFSNHYKSIQERRKQQISLKDTLERENLKIGRAHV